MSSAITGIVLNWVFAYPNPASADTVPGKQAIMTAILILSCGIGEKTPSFLSLPHPLNSGTDTDDYDMKESS